MLVPMQGGVANLQKRNRTLPSQQAALATVDIPKVYIFNVSPRPWKGIGAGTSFIVPACPKGRRYSDPLEIDALFLSERDLADGGNNLDAIMDAGQNVARDVIGMSSGSPALSLHTTSGEWQGLFWSMNEEPDEEELVEAESKLRQYMQLVYTQGATIIEQKMPENQDPVLRMTERKNYNLAAAYLGFKPLFGEGEMRLSTCPECQEQVQEGAKFCKHCHQAIDAASVNARNKKRERENAKLTKDEDEDEVKTV